MRAIAVLLALSCFPLSAIIENGEVSVTSREPISLRGFWNFTANGIQKHLRIDKEWRLQGVENVAQATFSLALDVAPEVRGGDFGLILPPVSAAVKLFLNGNLIAARGYVGSEFRFPQNSSEAFAWYPIKGELLHTGLRQILTLEITGFQGGGGIYGNAHIYFGGLDAIRHKYNFIFITTAFLAAAIFMIAVFHFALVSDKNYRRANLHYVLLSLAMAFHVIGMNGLGYFLFDNFLFNAALIHIIIAAFPFALVGFSLRYFQLQYPRIRRAAYYYGGAMTLFLLTLAFYPDAIGIYLRYGLPFGVTAMALSLCFALYCAVRGVMRRLEGSRIVLVGLAVYGAAVLNDVLFYFSYATSLKLADGGFLFAVVCIAVALAGRLQRAAKEKEELMEWHKEISLAAQIQHLALPTRSLKTKYINIATLFKPMKIIGGDFFAFHEISDATTGVFIADVSGHGIAAALTVNTLKSIFLQQREVAHDPARLLQNMNRALFPHLQEQFVTAAYCVVDFEKNVLRFAQAGHPPAYLQLSGEAKLEKIKPKGRFLGFEADLTYETVEVDLAKYERIFMYSDGVIEAGSLHGLPYSSQRLEDFLMASAALSGERLLQNLEDDVFTQTKTAMNTDDDSSCVVVDLKRFAAL